jgi:hypothetical protein
MAELSCPCCDHICCIRKLLKLRLQHIASAHFLLFIFPNRQWRNQLLTTSTVDEQEVFFGDLHAQLLLWIVELADPPAFGESAQRELAWVRARKLDDLEPRDLVRGVVGGGRSTLRVGSYDFRWRLEAAFEALDKDGTQGTSAQVRGQGFMAVEDVAVGGQEMEQTLE